MSINESFWESIDSWAFLLFVPKSCLGASSTNTILLISNCSAFVVLNEKNISFAKAVSSFSTGGCTLILVIFGPVYGASRSINTPWGWLLWVFCLLSTGILYTNWARISLSAHRLIIPFHSENFSNITSWRRRYSCKVDISLRNECIMIGNSTLYPPTAWAIWYIAISNTFWSKQTPRFPCKCGWSLIKSAAAPYWNDFDEAQTVATTPVITCAAIVDWVIKYKCGSIIPENIYWNTMVSMIVLFSWKYLIWSATLSSFRCSAFSCDDLVLKYPALAIELSDFFVLPPSLDTKWDGIRRVAPLTLTNISLTTSNLNSLRYPYTTNEASKVPPNTPRRGGNSRATLSENAATLGRTIRSQYLNIDMNWAPPTIKSILIFIGWAGYAVST